MDHLDALMQRAQTAGLPVLLTVEGTREALPAGIDRAAYQIVEDALTDALEKTNPAHAHVTVRYATDALQLEISDDRRSTLATESDTDSGACPTSPTLPPYARPRPNTSGASRRSSTVRWRRCRRCTAALAPDRVAIRDHANMSSGVRPS